MARPRTWKEWIYMAVITLVTVAALLLPVFVIDTIHDDTARILEEVEQEAIAANERAIRVNVLTISCLLLIEPEERGEADLDRCIREGFAEVQDQ